MVVCLLLYKKLKGKDVVVADLAEEGNGEVLSVDVEGVVNEILADFHHDAHELRQSLSNNHGEGILEEES